MLPASDFHPSIIFTLHLDDFEKVSVFRDRKYACLHLMIMVLKNCSYLEHAAVVVGINGICKSHLFQWAI